jgi:pimeloyl-ACP methyl ester carboxylesterase
MPAFAYLPGLDGSAELLFMQEARLAERYDLVRVPWRHDVTAEHGTLVDDVERALDTAGAERAVVFAESFGGTVGLLFALRRPERVERLVLFNTFAWYPNRELVRLGRVLARRAHPKVVHAVRQIVDTPLLALEGVRPDARRRFLEATYRQPLAAYARRLDLIEAFDVRARLGDISVRTLVVGAENDRVVPIGASRELAARIPGASLRILPHVGHAALMTPGISLVDIMDECWPAARVA